MTVANSQERRDRDDLPARQIDLFVRFGPMAAISIHTCSLRQGLLRRDCGIQVTAHRPSPYRTILTAAGKHKILRNPAAPFASSTSDPP